MHCTILHGFMYGGHTKRANKPFNSFVVKSANTRTIERAICKNSLDWLGSNIIGTVMHLPVAPTQGLCSNSRHQSKGYHVCLGWCTCLSSSPALGGAPMACFGLFVLWLRLVTRKISSHLTMK